MNIRVGDTITLDEIEVYVLAAKDEGGAWNSDTGAEGVEYIGVDKNHDLSFYVKGSDYVGSIDYDQSPGTYGYEWGGYGTVTGIQDTAVGTGLSNTNALIGMNLQPDTSGWWVIWDKVTDFRSTYGHNWFVPSKDELNLIYENKSNLNNLSTSGSSYYWSSSEVSYDPNMARVQDFKSGLQNIYYKKRNSNRARLCRYITSSDFYEKKTWADNELITAVELNRIENRIKELHSSYESHEWVNDEVITAERLNNIETQLGTSKTWLENELITDVKLNNIEDRLVNL